jgi:hypothetical protein
VPQGSSGAVWLVFSNHLGGEGRVVGKPSFGHGLVEGFGCRGSEGGGGIENEFSVLFVPDDVRGCSLPGLGDGETPHVCIEVLDAVDDDLGSVCSRG